MTGYSDDQLAFVEKLEHLAAFAGSEADDEAPELLAEIQDEFAEMKRALAREDVAEDERLTVVDVTDFADGIRDEFPLAAKGCQVLVSAWLYREWSCAAIR